MGQFGQAAILATEFATSKGLSPRDAWDLAMSRLSSSASSQMKVCPRNAFLGLCEAGAVVGIKPGRYCAIRKNKNGDYAVKALSILRTSSGIDKRTLWAKVTAPDVLKENQQIDVVLSLFGKNLLH